MSKKNKNVKLIPPIEIDCVRAAVLQHFIHTQRTRNVMITGKIIGCNKKPVTVYLFIIKTIFDYHSLRVT